MQNSQSSLLLNASNVASAKRSPKILLGGQHQPTLLRCLDGWSRRYGVPRAFLIQFVAEGESLAHFANDSFDMAVLQAPSSQQAGEMIGQLVRVARQGLIICSRR